MRKATDPNGCSCATAQQVTRCSVQTHAERIAVLTKAQLRQRKAAGGVQAVNDAQQPIVVLLRPQLQHRACTAHMRCRGLHFQTLVSPATDVIHKEKAL